MTDTESPSDRRFSRSVRNHVRPWLSPRRARFWVLAALLVYTAAGFLLLPLWVESLIVGELRTQTGHEARIERVRVNPYVLSVELQGFELRDPQGVPWIGFDRLRINFQLSSLFRWAWTFREVQLEGADLLFERFASGDTRLSRLLAQRSPPTPASGDHGTPRLLIGELGIHGARIRIHDAVPDKPVRLEFTPIDVSVEELSTLPEHSGEQVTTVRMPGGARASWTGAIRLTPLRLSGHFRLENLGPGPAIRYLPGWLPIDALQATLSLETDYRLGWSREGGIDAALENLNGNLSDLSIGGFGESGSFLATRSLAFSGGSVNFQERRVRFGQIRGDGLAIETWIRGDGTMNLQDLVPPAGNDGGAPSGWHVSVASLDLAAGRIGFEDRRIEPAATAVVTNLSLQVNDIDSEPGARFPVTASAGLDAGGQLGFEGTLGALPQLALEGELRLEAIPLVMAQPYLAQFARVRIEQGAVSSTVDVALKPGEALRLDGSLGLTDLQVRNMHENGPEDRPLLSFGALSLDPFELDAAARRVDVSAVSISQPDAVLVIRPDRTTNLSALVVPPEERGFPFSGDDAPPAGPGPDGAGAASAAPTGSKWTVRIARVSLGEGRLDFSDLSLPLPFSTRVHSLQGNVSTLDSDSSEPAQIELEGGVDEYGLARASGSMDALNPLRGTDIQVRFRNIRMSHLSPYSVQFAGRKIAEGKLDLDLRYRIDAGQLRASNDIVMSDLVLGDKVEAPGAASLPLSLAVALLKDANGVIDIELPIEGDVGDPQFRIGGVIWQAFTGLITKIVSAPFRLLGRLVGGGEEDLGQFEFLAGRADLTPPEQEKIARLQQALQQRPQLTVEVPGAFNTEVDMPALRLQQLRAAVTERLGPDSTLPDGRDALLAPGVRDVLEQLYHERLPETPLEALRERHRAPPEGRPEAEPVLDQQAYAADLRDRLLSLQQVETADLEALADRRAQVIRDALLESGQVDAARVGLAPAEQGEAKADEWVVVKLRAGSD